MQRTSKMLQWQPFIVFLVSFLIVIFSIYKIISMVSPEKNLSSFEDQSLKQINYFLSNPSKLNYNSLEKVTTEFPKNNPYLMQNTQNISEIKNFAPDQQNLIVRNKLLDLKIEIFIDQINKIFKEKEPLIFKISFWIYGILAWSASICGGLILKYWTEKLIRRCWGKLE